MSYIWQLRPLAPIVWPKAVAELAVWYVRHDQAEAAAEIPKIWADHFASVADYWDHKRRHPDTPAGAMMTLYRWAKYIPVTAAVVTLNPIVFAIAVLDVRRRRPDAKPTFWQQAYNTIAWRLNLP